MERAALLQLSREILDGPCASFVWCHQSRRHGGTLVGLAPQTKLQAHSNWNMKHYELVEILSNLNVKPSLHERKPPRTNVKPPYWRLSGDGSRCHA